MSRHIFTSVVLVLSLSLASLPADSFARGFGGGGFRGGSFGGGGFDRGSFGGGGASFDRGSFGGGSFGGGGFDRGSVSAGGFNRSSFGGGNYGGGLDRSNFGGDSFNRGSLGGSGYSAGGYRAGGAEGGYRAADYGGSLNRGNLNSFLDLPTDAGMHAAGGYSARAYQGAGGTDVAHVSAGERGAAVTPYGAAAGGRYAGATAVKGPEGNTYVHTSTAGRGVAVGPNGAAAGRYNTGRTAINGTPVNGRAVAGHAYGGYGYGTHAWSPTYCRAQAVAGRGWFAGSGIYSGAWCNAHPWAWRPAAWAAADWATAAWTTATWANAAAWIGCAPQYYGYNYGDDIVYQDGDVYYGGQLAGTPQQYYQEAADLANCGAASPPDNAQWLPLGVFGLMPDGSKTPDMVFQLAVDKQGVIRGNYYDQVTQTNLPVTGQVDKKNQRVAWSVSGGKGNDKGLVVETGLYNLTQEDSTALVHFGADKTQQEVLVRMQQPGQEDESAGG